MKIDRLTRAAFAEFGEVISTEGTDHFPINNGTTERYHDLANIDVAERNRKPLVNIFRGQPRRFPFAVTMMERHPLGSQAFIPLSRNSYLIVVSPRGDFQPRDLRAFWRIPHITVFRGENITDKIKIRSTGNFAEVPA
jgi:ureidoglycolate lyase